MGFYVPWLVDAARLAAQGTGKQVIVQSGWNTRGHGGLRLLEVLVGHHTGTPASSPGDYPSLNVVQNGRSDLPGPLGNYGLGRSGSIYVIAAGIAYHAGASAYAGYYDLNDESLGVEAESPGDGTWTPDQLYMYPRLVAAVLQYMHRGVDRYVSHRTCATPAGRKPDPTGISDEWMRQQAVTALEDDMDQTDLQLDPSTGKPAVDTNGNPFTVGATWFYSNKAVWDLTAAVAALSAKVDTLLGAQDADTAAVKSAAKEGTTEALVAGTVDVAVTIAGNPTVTVEGGSRV